MTLVSDPKIQGPIPAGRMPKHVAVIMDGNGRWARLRGKPRVFGHRQGVDSVRECVRAAGEWGIRYLTLFAFSDENWGRPLDEVSVIMQLLDTYIRKEREELNRNNVRFRAIGDLTKLKPATRELIHETTKMLAGNTGLVLTVALSYGSRGEITRACKDLARRVAAGDLTVDDISPDMVTARLDTAGMPDPDLLIRTSGEQRISNFLLWQCAYTEFYFTATHWPDFGREEFALALRSYDDRERRYGLTGAQVGPSLDVEKTLC